MLDPTNLVGILDPMRALAHTRSDFVFLPEAPSTAAPPEGSRIRQVSRTLPDFFSQKAGEPPAVDASRYRLTIAGMVSRTTQLSAEALRLNFAQHEILVQSDGDASGRARPATWCGCRIDEVLDYAGVSQPGGYVEFIGACSSLPEDRREPFVGLVSIDHLQLHPFLLGWSIDGKPLDAAQGAPLAALIPADGGYRRVRWLHRINLLVHPPLWVVG
ncbi:MAG: molybdopterin-dependent oxidoreductase [Verrucomicrobia bacterium]|nr:molybdopterin-dependent oxidoreductase [Verrucomicrobiota bacterium]